jgi:hypothetical protein
VLFAVGSVKGSPGATTLAVTLASVWPTATGGSVIVVEADCAGGDVGGRCWMPDTPGVASLATAARAGVVPVEAHAAPMPCGAWVVVAPAERQPATVAVGLLVQAGLARWAHTRPVIADVGRLDDGAPGSELAAAADVLIVCTRGDEASLARLATAGLSADTARVVLIGGCDYSLREVQDALGVPVTAEIPWDPRSAQVVWGQAKPPPNWIRRGLPATTVALAAQLAHTTPLLRALASPTKEAKPVIRPSSGPSGRSGSSRPSGVDVWLDAAKKVQL